MSGGALPAVEEEAASLFALNAAILAWACWRCCLPVGAAVALTAEEEGVPFRKAASAPSVWKRLARSPPAACSAIRAAYLLCG